MTCISSRINNINDNVIINKIINLTNKFQNNIMFSWILGHCEIIGNERADVPAKEKANKQYKRNF